MTDFPAITLVHHRVNVRSADVRGAAVGIHATSRYVWLRGACLAGLTIAAALTPGDDARARVNGARGAARQEAVVEDRQGGPPIMAIVSLQSQGVTIYDANGWIMRAPVSSGQKGRETPAGVYAVLAKEVAHYSNLYDDAFMPHMQRITWSGIALHGGPLPGYAASHGCIRLPYGFAEHLFGTTKVGMRVIVAPTDVEPVDITHPALQLARPGATEEAARRAAAASEEARKAEQARRAAVTALKDADREAGKAAAPVRTAERAKLSAEARLAAAERALAAAHPDDATDRLTAARDKAQADVTETDAAVTAAKADQQQKVDAATTARQAVTDAETRRTTTAEAARQAKRDLEPTSVFISRKTQRLYVRQAFQPVLDVPVTIQDADRQIGTHVFTAVAADGAAGLRWNVVSLRSSSGGGAADTATAALDRITIPAEARERLAGMVSPRSSVIVSDEAMSEETDKDTDFIVVMSNEPQGGIKFRRRGSGTLVARHERERPMPPYFFLHQQQSYRRPLTW